MERHGAGKRLAIRFGITLAALLLAVLLYRPILLIFGPFLLAYFLARAIEPAVRRIGREKPGVRRVVSVVLVILAFSAGFAALVWLTYRLVTELRQLSADWAQILDGGTRMAKDFVRRLTQGSESGRFQRRALALVDSLSGALSGLVAELTAALLARMTGAARHAPLILMFLLVLAMGACILSQDLPARAARARAKIGADRNQTLAHMLAGIRAAFGGYLLRGVIRALAVMVTCLAAFSILNVPYRATLAILLGILDFLPYVGSGTVLLPWCVYSFATGRWWTGLWLLAAYCAQIVERMLIRRRAADKGRSITAFAELCCVFLGWKLWGILGVLLGPVLARIVVDLYRAGVFDSTLRDLRTLGRAILDRLKTKS